MAKKRQPHLGGQQNDNRVKQGQQGEIQKAQPDPGAYDGAKGENDDKLALSLIQALLGIIVSLVSLVFVPWAMCVVASAGNLNKELCDRTLAARAAVKTEMDKKDVELKALGERLVGDLKKESEYLAKQRAENANRWSRSWEGLDDRMAQQEEKIRIFKAYLKEKPK